MPLTKVMIHAVWGTQNRMPFLVRDVRAQVIDHILQNAKEKDIHIDSLNGHLDHLHCLFELHHDISLPKTIQLIKGESSYWINKNKLTVSKFGWANDYYAASVGESDLGQVRRYIQNQEEHHAKKSFAEEYEGFIKSVDLQVPAVVGLKPFRS